MFLATHHINNKQNFLFRVSDVIEWKQGDFHHPNYKQILIHKICPTHTHTQISTYAI